MEKAITLLFLAFMAVMLAALFGLGFVVIEKGMPGGDIPIAFGLATVDGALFWANCLLSALAAVFVAAVVIDVTRW